MNKVLAALSVSFLSFLSLSGVLQYQDANQEGTYRRGAHQIEIQEGIREEEPDLEGSKAQLTDIRSTRVAGGPARSTTVTNETTRWTTRLHQRGEIKTRLCRVPVPASSGSRCHRRARRREETPPERETKRGESRSQRLERETGERGSWKQMS